MRGLRILLLIGGIAAIVFGAQNTMLSMANSTPTKIKYADWIAKRPDAQWLEFDDAWVDFRHAIEIQTLSKSRGSSTSSVTKREYFAPVYRERDDMQNVCAFIKCNDQKSIAMAMEGTGNNYTGDAFANWYAEADQRLNVQRTVKGMARSGLFDDSDDRRELSKAAQGRIDPKYIVIDENEEPHGLEGVMLLGLGGALVLAFVGSLFIKKKQPIYPAYTPMPPGAQNYMPPQPYPQAGRPAPYQPGFQQQPAPYQPQPGPYQPPQPGPYQPPRPPQA